MRNQLTLKYAFFSFLVCLQFSMALSQATKKPNIIIILADDLGYKDLSCYGSSFYETPNLDKLAYKGIQFTQSYSSSPVCSPTRASLLTGKYPIKTGITDWIKGRQAEHGAKPFEKLIANPINYNLALTETTIAELALANGYQTFFAGKWHLGEEEKYWPQNQGFTTNKGGWSKGSPNGKINDTIGGFFTPYQNPMLPDGEKGEYLTDRLTNECLQFIQDSKDKPFFLFHSMYAVHNPLQAPKPLIDKYLAKKDKLKNSAQERFISNEAWMKNHKEWKTRILQDNAKYAAMIENMDWNIGRMLDKLKELNLLNNTLIIFTSDNGGLSTAEGSPTSNQPLRAGKGWLYEGGIRVPLILYYENKIKKGEIVDLPINTIDIFPTLAACINTKYKKANDIDGEDIFKMLMQKEVYKKRNLFWHYPHYSNQGGKPGLAILEAGFKLIYNFEDESVELYNLKQDLQEKNNIALQQPNLVKSLKEKLFKSIKDYPIAPMKVNPNYSNN